MDNTFVWNELHSTDAPKSLAFFGKLFDWEIEKMDMGERTYHFVKVGGEGKGGIMQQANPGAPSMFLSYVQVADLAAKTAQVAELGGKVLMADQAAGDMGRFSVVADPTGAVFALWHPNPMS